MDGIKRRPKRKLTKKDGHWDTSDLYKGGKNPFEIEWVKYFNPMKGKDQILLLYKDRKTKKIRKYRILR